MALLSSFSEDVARKRSGGRHSSESSEAAARQYMNESFQPLDWLAVVVRNAKTGETIQRISTAEKISSPEFLAWLRHKNADGFDIYLSLNTFQNHARGRTKADVKDIRHLYLDLDDGAPEKLAAIHQDTIVPSPNYVLNTSPDKYQVIWKVEGISHDDAEALLRTLAQRFGGDPAATDSTRVFRLPGFSNKKYDQDFQVVFQPEAAANHTYHRADFKVDGLAQERHPSLPSPASARRVPDGEGTSQSERDWAYAIRHLKQGDDPDEIIREMACYRSADLYDNNDPTKLVAARKPNPRYYAQHTVTQAMAHLGITHSKPSRLSAELGRSSADMEPNR
jgi:hypothetical protein